MSLPLTHMVERCHQFLSEVLSVGGYAIDLTAGNGFDTYYLAQTVGNSGRVLAFDLQAQAIENSYKRLSQQGITVRCLEYPVADLEPGVSLVQADHADLMKWTEQRPQAIIANLGYLPGGDKEIVTRPESTENALTAACELLAPDGRIAVVVYPGHPGGENEADVVEQLFARLDVTLFNVLHLRAIGRLQAPSLIIAGKAS